MSSGRASGRVRWKRSACLLLPAAVLTGVLFALTAQGALATSFSVAGTPFMATATSVTGSGYVNYNQTLPLNNGTQVDVATNALRTATIKNFCMAIKMGPITTLLKAGSGATPVSGSNVAFLVKNFNANGEMQNIVMGQDASSLSAVPGRSGAAGAFGMQATGVTLTGAAMQAREMAAGTITLPGLSMSVTRGGGC